MSEMGTILGPMRIPFLILTPACVLLGFGSALWRSGSVSLVYLALGFIGALSAHISVNALNEYFDFKSGLDFRTKRTPFSGGSGTLPKRPEKASNALHTGLATISITAVTGLYFLLVRGLSLLPLGLVGLFIVCTYTIWLTRHPLLSLIAPGLGFGPLMTMGTDFVLTGGYSWTAFVSSLIPFFLVSDLLLLNQFPDIDADRTVGRRNFPIAVGRRISVFIYGAFLLLAYSSVITGVWCGCLPRNGLIGLASLVVAVPTFFGVFRYGEHIERLMPYMGLNVIVVITTPVLVAIGFLIG